MDSISIKKIKEKFDVLVPFLNERTRRLWAATEAHSLGRGGITAVAQATGLSRTTITLGLQELCTPGANDQRIRRRGGGREALTVTQPELTAALEQLIEPNTRGDPMSPLRWTCKSTRILAQELTQHGYSISYGTVATLLHQLGYSLQSNRKRYEGKQHPDRNAQFGYINKMTSEFQDRGLPVISVDAKKKELVGNFKNSGREWRPHGQALEVNAYDFIDPTSGKAIPFGIYDQTLNAGWVSVGLDHDTAAFAVESIRQWWWHMGQFAYPDAEELLILADSGGSNGYRIRLWKYCLQTLATETERKIVVCHFPPGTSKWNKIEHRMFCHITENWRGRPLISHEVIVNLIGTTTTRTGLKIKAQLDNGSYPTGLKITDEQMQQINIITADFHGEWNYMICPK